MNITKRNNQKFHKMINNKRVVICGPAPYLNNMKNGKNIDNYDTVVRVNRGHNLTKNPQIFGNRTDILYHCLSENKENGGKITNDMYNHFKLIVSAFPRLSPKDRTSFPKGNIQQFRNFKQKFKNKLSVIGKHFYLNLEKKIGCRPNTGIIAILHILRHNPKELYLTGFTFFKDGYSSLYRNSIDGKKITEKNSNKAVIKRMANCNFKGRHNQFLMFRHLRNIISKKIKNIKLDEELIKILSFNLQEYKIKHKLNGKTNEQVFNHYLLH